LHHLAALALGDVRGAQVRRSLLLTTLLFLLMVGAGHRARFVRTAAADALAAGAASANDANANDDAYSVTTHPLAEFREVRP
jgi:hypothetical protein